MNIAKMLEKLAEDVKLPSIFTDRNGICSLVIDGMPIVIAQHEESDAIAISATFAAPDLTNVEVLADLLNGNRLGTRTGGAVLSVDERGRILMSMRLQGTSLTYERFKMVLERFLNYLEYWHNRVPGGGTAAMYSYALA